MGAHLQSALKTLGIDAYFGSELIEHLFCEHFPQSKAVENLLKHLVRVDIIGIVLVTFIRASGAARHRSKRSLERVRLDEKNLN